MFQAIYFPHILKQIHHLVRNVLEYQREIPMHSKNPSMKVLLCTRAECMQMSCILAPLRLSQLNCFLMFLLLNSEFQESCVHMTAILIFCIRNRVDLRDAWSSSPISIYLICGHHCVRHRGAEWTASGPALNVHWTQGWEQACGGHPV